MKRKLSIVLLLCVLSMVSVFESQGQEIGYLMKMKQYQVLKDRLIASSTGIKQPSDYPRLQFRLSLERIKWFRGYAKRKHTSMSGIVKDYIEHLYQQDHSN